MDRITINGVAYVRADLAQSAPTAAPATPAVARIPQPKMVERRCNWCKGVFMARAVDVKRGWGKFCSKSCKASRQEKNTGQHRAYREYREEIENDECAGHIFDSGYFGHGQN